MPTGAYRRVFEPKRLALALKVPRARNFLKGLRCNRWEREVWFKWHKKFCWTLYCPIKFADCIGFVVVMPLAVLDVTERELDALACSDECIDAEYTLAIWGRVDGHLVVFDYGLPDNDLVKGRRTDYGKLPPRTK
jgi:hypothetical protein